MNGAAVSSAARLTPIRHDEQLYPYGTGDLNGDGKGDMLWRISDSSVVLACV